MKRSSLRRRLTFILLGLTVATWVASVFFAVLYARQLTIRQADLHLERYAAIALHTMDAVLADPATENYFRKRTVSERQQNVVRITSFAGTDGNAINLWFGKKQLLLGEGTPALPRRETEGIVTNTLADGSRWRTLYRHSSHSGILWAGGVKLSSTHQELLAASKLILLPASIILLAAIGILLFGIRRGLRPLDELALQISARRPNALEPFDAANAPAELVPLLGSLNDLLDRLRRALTSEHRFTSNAAHELQTPLAAIGAAVQNAHRQLEDRAECRDTRQILERVSDRIAEAAETVRQLLTLARLDPEQEFERESIDLNQLTLEVMAEVGAIASARGVSVRFDDQRRVVFHGHMEWLRILLRNLCINAFKYSTASSEVDVLLESLPGAVALVIANDCEPIAQEHFQRLTERFYYPNAADHGVGLGLSIVDRIVELHGGELRLSGWQEGRGFRVEIRLPQPHSSVPV
jgi:signal transduction histidine kinase